MALIAHYPLNGDTKDYSGYGNDAVNHGAVEKEEGKIGNCYSFNGVNSSMEYKDKLGGVLDTKDKVSLAVWVRPDEVNTAGYFLTKNDTNYGDIQYGFLVQNGRFQFTLNGTHRAFSNYRPTIGEWVHVSCVYDGLTAKIYVNGLLDVAAPYTGNLLSSSWLSIGNRRSSSVFFKGLLNDIRIYDHALSDKEVKEIAKAKVLHYKFDPHETTTTNIFDFDVSDRCWNGGGSVCSLRTITSKNSMKFVGRSSLHSSSGYAYTYPLFPTTNDIHTFSMVVTNKGDKPVRFDAKLRNGSNGTDLGGGVVVSVGSGETARVVTTSISPVSSDLITAAISSYSDTDGNINIEVSEIQLEVGSVATGFVVGTRSSSTVRDSSGFGNDGTVAVTTAPTWSEDSPVGRGSMEFAGSKFIEANHKIPLWGDFTVSFWVNTNPTNTATLGCSRTVLGKGFSIFLLNGAIRWDTGDQQWSTGHVVKLNQWVHYTFVKRGNVKELYENAILVKSTSYTGSMTNLGSLYTIGMSQVGGSVYGNPLNGTVSDYRIYATALSPEDILELYQTRASIDNLGNLFIQEIDEINNSSKEVDSRGIARFNEFNEVGRPVRYIRDWLNGSTSNTSNHWVEIQAIDPSGTNVAKGKASPSALITDGSTATNPYYSGGSGLKSVTVDLGAAYNITYLHIWHYWSDKRTYHNTKTEVSTDGTNWVTVFDSAVEGEYAESSEGKRILLYPDKVSFGSDGNIYTNEILEN